MNIPGIKPVHLKYMSNGFYETVSSRIEELRSARNETRVETKRFFEYLLDKIDANKFDAVRNRFISEMATSSNVNMLKYLDPITWLESKLRLCWTLELNKKPPQRILDFGTGPGHFPFVATFYGHDVTGTDLPARARGAAEGDHLYDALCELYEVKRIPHEIRSNAPVGDVGGRYDMVTAFLAAFNVNGDKLPWSEKTWQFFLADLKRNVLEEPGTVFMTLDERKLTDESWTYLKSLSDWSVEMSKQIRISDFSSLSGSSN